MQPKKSNMTTKAVRRPWQPPALVELPIGRETRSAVENRQEASGARTSGQIDNAYPESPAAPAAKFGFSLEWAFPLSARWED
jgi:hypothetical protein